MTRIVHENCGKPPCECDCPASIRRPMRCRVELPPGWTITLQRLPESMNKRERQSWPVKRRELKEITEEIAWLARKEKVPKATTRRFVRVTIHKARGVRDDPANRDSRAKSILDALVANGLLIDDNDRYLDWGGVIEGEKRPTPQTVIDIVDFPSESDRRAKAAA